MKSNDPDGGRGKGINHMGNRIIEKAKKGEPSIGTFTQLKSSVVIDALAYTGLDYLVIDMEHAPLGTDEADELIAILGRRSRSNSNGRYGGRHRVQFRSRIKQDGTQKAQ